MNGIDPPSEPIFDYKRPIKELNERIPCRKCGISHGNGVTDTKEYTHTFIDLCEKCLYENFCTLLQVIPK